MPAADGVAVHHRDHGLRHHADEPLQVEHVQARDAVLAHVTAVAADLLIAAAAERLVLMAAAVVGAGEDDDADARVVARFGECVVQLVHGERGERVAALGPVDGDFRDTVRRLVDDLAVLLAGLPCDGAHDRPFGAQRTRKPDARYEEVSTGCAHSTAQHALLAPPYPRMQNNYAKMTSETGAGCRSRRAGGDRQKCGAAGPRDKNRVEGRRQGARPGEAASARSRPRRSRGEGRAQGRGQTSRTGRGKRNRCRQAKASMKSRANLAANVAPRQSGQSKRLIRDAGSSRDYRNRGFQASKTQRTRKPAPCAPEDAVRGQTRAQLFGKGSTHPALIPYSADRPRRR